MEQPSQNASFWILESEKVTSSEIEQLNELLWQLSPDKGKKQTDPIKMQNCLQTGCIAVTIVSGMIVGMAQLATYDHVADGIVGMLHCVVVDKNHQGKGYAKRMLTALHAEAKSLRIKIIDLTSSPEKITAHKLYLSAGYEHRETENYRKVIVRVSATS